MLDNGLSSVAIKPLNVNDKNSLVNVIFQVIKILQCSTVCTMYVCACLKFEIRAVRLAQLCNNRKKFK